MKSIKNLILKLIPSILLLTFTASSQLMSLTPIEQEFLYSQDITLAIKKNSLVEKIHELQEILNDREEMDSLGLAGIVKYTKQNQNHFEKALTIIFKQLQNQPSTVIESFKTLLNKAIKSKGSILHPKQRRYLSIQMLPKIKKKYAKTTVQKKPAAVASKTGSPTKTLSSTLVQQKLPSAVTPQIATSIIPASLIQSALKSIKLKQKVKKLSAIMMLAENNTFKPVIQDVFGNALVSILQDKKLVKKNKKLVINILRQATKTSLLSKAQQQYVKKILIPKAQGKLRRKKKIRKQRKKARKARKNKHKKKKKLKVKKITAAVVQAVLKKATKARQIKSLTKLVYQAKGQKVTTKAQDAFGNALFALFKQRVSLSAYDAYKLKKLLIKSKTSPLLAPTQQAYVKTQMLPKLK